MTWQFWVLSAIVGWAFSSAALMHWWLPDPPAPPARTYIVGCVAGAIGAILGAYVAPGREVLAAIAGAAVLLSAVQCLWLRGGPTTR